MKDGERSLRRAQSGETLVEAHSDTEVQIVRYAWVLGERQTEHLTAGSLQKCARAFLELKGHFLE